MKKSHIIILVGIAALIVGLIVFSAGDFSTYDTIDAAKKKPGKYVHIIAKVDKSQAIEYDAVNNPLYALTIAFSRRTPFSVTLTLLKRKAARIFSLSTG